MYDQKNREFYNNFMFNISNIIFIFKKIQRDTIFKHVVFLIVIITFNSIIYSADLPKVQLYFQNKNSNDKIPFIVEVASSNTDKAKGLMYRQHLEANTGMIFVYSKPQVMNFWMKNTLIPLSIAFIDTTGEVIAIYDMQPLDETGVSSIKPAKYAIEMDQGWFTIRKIKIGSKVSLENLIP